MHIIRHGVYKTFEHFFKEVNNMDNGHTRVEDYSCNSLNELHITVLLQCIENMFLYTTNPNKFLSLKNL